MNDFDTELDNNPADWQLRAIYADWLTDQNRPNEAEVQYLLAKLQRHPAKCTKTQYKRDQDNYYVVDEAGELITEERVDYCWCSENFKPHGIYTLPNVVYDNRIKMRGYVITYFSTRKQAEDALILTPKEN